MTKYNFCFLVGSEYSAPPYTHLFVYFFNLSTYVLVKKKRLFNTHKVTFIYPFIAPYMGKFKL